MRTRIGTYSHAVLVRTSTCCFELECVNPCHVIFRQGNLRALYGVLLCIAAAPKGAKEREANNSLFAAAQQLLNDEYETAGASGPMRKTVENTLKSLMA